MAKRLLFFTISYPYGVGEVWKKHELEVFVQHFDEVIVIPFHFGGNFDNPKPAIEGVKYEKPLFRHLPLRHWLRVLPHILLNERVSYYLKELFDQQAFRSYLNFRAWTRSAFVAERLYQHPLIKKYLIHTQVPTVAYFFWGRRTSEVVPLIDNPNIKIVIKYHGFDLYAYRYKTNYIPFQKMQISKSDRILTISEDGHRYLANLYPEHASKIKVAKLGANGIGLSKQGENGILNIVSCSSIIPLKRVSLIAKALQQIKDCKIHWTHLGNGHLMKELKALAQNFPPNVSYKFPGRIPSSEVLPFYVNTPIDLFINVSTTEGIPVSIMEAMSAGIPVLATDVGGTSEIVNDRNGKLLPSDINENELSMEILNFSNKTPEEKLKYRANAFQTYEQHYNANLNAEKLVEDLKALSDNS